MSNSPRIAVVGAGLGGAATAALLLQEGFNVRVYEQAPGFSRLGAGIHVGPNVMKVLRRIGIEDEMNRQGSRPDFWYSRHWETGDVLAQIPLGDYAVKHYGASYLTVHRGDFHELLIKALPSDRVSFDKCLTDQKLLDQLTAVHTRAADTFGVNATPTFFINGKRLQAAPEIAEFDKVLEPLLAQG